MGGVLVAILVIVGLITIAAVMVVRQKRRKKKNISFGNALYVEGLLNEVKRI